MHAPVARRQSAVPAGTLARELGRHRRDDVVADMMQMSGPGLTGTLLTGTLLTGTLLTGALVAFLDCLQEIPCFVQEALPRLQHLGLRQAA
jgi:hypothetical protein